jgi:hypothetical protein
MNIVDFDKISVMTAKTCGSTYGSRKIVYLVDSNNILFIDKKEMILNQLKACQRLSPYVSYPDKALVEKEISDLKMALDLIE